MSLAEYSKQVSIRERRKNLFYLRKVTKVLEESSWGRLWVKASCQNEEKGSKCEDVALWLNLKLKHSWEKFREHVKIGMTRFNSFEALSK